MNRNQTIGAEVLVLLGNSLKRVPALVKLLHLRCKKSNMVKMEYWNIETYQSHTDLEGFELVNILLGDSVITALGILEHDRCLILERGTPTRGDVSVIDPDTAAEREIGLQQGVLNCLVRNLLCSVRPHLE